MFRLTLRNLVARRVRLLMSTLAIVLGIGFLAGVMTFSNGLGGTFTRLTTGTTSDAEVALKRETTAGNSYAQSTTKQLLDSSVVTQLGRLPEVDKAVGTLSAFGAYLLDKDGDVAGGQGAPTLVATPNHTLNMAGEEKITVAKGRFPTAAGEIALDVSAAASARYAIGDKVTIILPDQPDLAKSKRTLNLVGTIQVAGGGTAGQTVLMVSVNQAQQYFAGGKDQYDAIELQAASGVTQEQLATAANKVIPDGYNATTGDQMVKDSESSINQFLNVITTFLTVFALIAILVGGFIIFNTFSILVGQRVRESALLRALGASRRQVTRAVLIEAFVMALVGGALGILVGLLLARGLAAMFSLIGLDINGDTLGLTVPTVAWGLAVALLVTMAAAWFPARRAAKVPPVAALRDDLVVQEKSLRPRAYIGIGATVLGIVLAAVGLQQGGGFGAILIGAGSTIWVITAAMLAPVIGRPVLVACRAVFSRVFGITGRLAAENALRSPRRTGATASALMIGLAVVSAIGVLAASLSATFNSTIDKEFAADIVVSAPSFQGFPTGIGTEMEKVDGVDLVVPDQVLIVDAAAAAGGDKQEQFPIDAVTSDYTSVYRLTTVSGSLDLAKDSIVLDEPTAESFKASVGSTITVTFQTGKKIPLKVAGIFAKSNSGSTAFVPMNVVDEAGMGRQDFSLSIKVADGANVATVIDGLKAVVKDYPVVSVQDKATFAESLQGQLNQLLYLIYGLLALAVIIAVFGIVNTLSLSVLERTREIGLVRAVGLTRRMLRRTVTLESVAIAVLGAILGLVVGLPVGMLLRQSLSEDIPTLAIPFGNLVIFLVVAIIIGVLAAVIPAIRASRLNVLAAISHE